MAIIRFIEIENGALINNLPVRNGQLIYARDTHATYIDNEGTRFNSNLIIKCNTLGDVLVPSSTVLYYAENVDKLFKYEVNEFIEVTDTIDIFELWVENDDSLSGYLTYNGRIFLPITSSSLVFSGDGSSLDDTIRDINNEIAAVLNPYIRQMVVTSENQTRFLIPIPMRTYFAEGNGVDIYVNGVKLTEGTDYTIDRINNQLILNNGIPINTELMCHFYYERTVQEVYQEMFIVSDKDSVTFTLTVPYTPGTKMTSLFINGIKQPKEAYTEINSTTFRLNGSVPKGSIVLFEYGMVTAKQ